jgi:two-component system, cell cycle sensor histidine kinase and response regulator CckA
MTGVTFVDTIAAAAFAIAFVAALFVRPRRVGRGAKAFLCLAMLVYLVTSISNMLEHSGITTLFDTYEDYGEILFLPFMLYFIYALWTKRELNRRHGIEEALRRGEKRYHSLFQALGEGFALHEIICDDDGAPRDYRFLEANPAFERLTGLSLAHIIGKTVMEILPKTEPEWIETYGQVALTGQPVTFQRYSAELNRHYEIYAFSPQHGRFATLFLDISARRKAEEAFEQERYLLHTLMDNVPDRIYFKDAESRFIATNRAVAKLFGLEDPSQAVGKRDADFFSTEHAKQALADEQRVIRTGKPVIGKVEKETWPDGHVTWAWTTKMPLRDAKGNVFGTFGVSRDITELRQAEEDLRSERDFNRNLIDTSPTFFVAIAPDGATLLMNQAMLDALGYKAEEVVGKDYLATFVPEDDRERLSTVFRALMESTEPTRNENCILTRDGKELLVEWHGRQVRKADGTLDYFFGVGIDVTDRRGLEEQLRQAQKMEAVGRLAGGVAHDFNNQLTIVRGYTDLLLSDLPDADPSRQLVEEVRKAATRAERLTGQLLAFSRKQMLRPRVANINRLLGEIANPLARMVGEDIRVAIIPDANLGNVEVDPGHFQQAVMNLAINARDAMPSGGQLAFETANVTLADDPESPHPDAPPGRYIMLIVKDTGLGMEPEVVERVFEPFFTTKDVGHGTGLGLSMVYGFVKQSGGTILLDSAPGKGASFRIYLPRVDAPEAAPGGAEDHVLPRGDETVLVVEDEDNVRMLVTRVLSQCGYTVLEAPHYEQALSLAEQHREEIDILVADVIMPGKTGPELAELLQPTMPGLLVLYMTGYAESDPIRRGILQSGENLLMKPFSPAALARKVREVLDGPATPEESD